MYQSYIAKHSPFLEPISYFTSGALGTFPVVGTPPASHVSASVTTNTVAGSCGFYSLIRLDNSYLFSNNVACSYSFNLHTDFSSQGLVTVTAFRGETDPGVVPVDVTSFFYIDRYPVEYTAASPFLQSGVGAITLDSIGRGSLDSVPCDVYFGLFVDFLDATPGTFDFIYSLRQVVNEIQVLQPQK